MATKFCETHSIEGGKQSLITVATPLKKSNGARRCVILPDCVEFSAFERHLIETHMEFTNKGVFRGEPAYFIELKYLRSIGEYQKYLSTTRYTSILKILAPSGRVKKEIPIAKVYANGRGTYFIIDQKKLGNKEY